MLNGPHASGMELGPDFVDPFSAQIGNTCAERFESVVDIKNVLGSFRAIPPCMDQHLLGQEAHGISKMKPSWACCSDSMTYGGDNRRFLA